MHKNYFLNILLLVTHNTKNEIRIDNYIRLETSERKTGNDGNFDIRTEYFFKLQKLVSRPLQFKLINWFPSTDSVRNWAEGGGTSCYIF